MCTQGAGQLARWGQLGAWVEAEGAAAGSSPKSLALRFDQGNIAELICTLGGREEDWTRQAFRSLLRGVTILVVKCLIYSFISVSIVRRT